MRAIFPLYFLFLYINSVLAQDVMHIPAKNSKPAIDCPMEGNPSRKKDVLEPLNRLKNRFQIPDNSDFDKKVTLEKMLGDGDPDQGKFNVKKAATITGYIVYVSPSPWAESCNCGTTINDYADIHVEIAQTPNEEKGGNTIVVESTPRVRNKKGDELTRETLRKLWKAKILVTVSGWLFYDKEHENVSRNIHGEEVESAQNRRQTCWELHPITKLNPYSKNGSQENVELALSFDSSNILTAENFNKKLFQCCNCCNCCCCHSHILPSSNNNNNWLVAIVALIGTLIASFVAAHISKRNTEKTLDANKQNEIYKKELEREFNLNLFLKENVAKFIQKATILNGALNQIILEDYEDGNTDLAMEGYEKTFQLREEIKNIYYSIKVALDGSKKQKELEKILDEYMNITCFKFNLGITDTSMYTQPIGRLFHMVRSIIHKNYTMPPEDIDIK